MKIRGHEATNELLRTLVLESADGSGGYRNLSNVALDRNLVSEGSPPTNFQTTSHADGIESMSASATSSR